MIFIFNCFIWLRNVVKPLIFLRQAQEDSPEGSSFINALTSIPICSMPAAHVSSSMAPAAIQS
ncbi:MAG TPA: hypothetical protein VIJ95_16985 [Hanamia sp.]